MLPCKMSMNNVVEGGVISAEQFPANWREGQDVCGGWQLLGASQYFSTNFPKNIRKLGLQCTGKTELLLLRLLAIFLR